MILNKLIISFICFAQGIQTTLCLPLINGDFIHPYENEFDDDLSLYPIHHVYPNDDVEGSSLVLYKEVPLESSYFEYPDPDQLPKTGRAGGILDNIVMEAINMFAPIPVKKTFNDTFVALQKQIKINDKEMKMEKRKQYNQKYKKKRKPVKDDDDENTNSDNSSDNEEGDDDNDEDEDEDEQVDDDEIDHELDDEFADEDKDEVSEFVDWIKDVIKDNLEDDPNANLEGWDQQDFNQLDQLHQDPNPEPIPATRQLEMELVNPYLEENSGGYWNWNNFEERQMQMPYSIGESYIQNFNMNPPQYPHQFSPRSGEVFDDDSFTWEESEYPNYAPEAVGVNDNDNEYYTYLVPMY